MRPRASKVTTTTKNALLSRSRRGMYPPHTWCSATALQSLKGAAVKTRASSSPFHLFPG